MTISQHSTGVLQASCSSSLAKWVGGAVTMFSICAHLLPYRELSLYSTDPI